MDPIFESYSKSIEQEQYEKATVAAAYVAKEMRDLAKHLGAKIDHNGVLVPIVDLKTVNIAKEMKMLSKQNILAAKIFADRNTDNVRLIYAFGGNDKFNAAGGSVPASDSKELVLKMKEYFNVKNWRQIPSAADVNAPLKNHPNWRM